MNAAQAFKKDETFYADKEDGYWYVFGDYTGFAYKECRNEEEANKLAKEYNNQKKKTKK